MKKVVFLSIVFLIGTNAFANKNNEIESESKYKFGFCIGGNFSQLNPRASYKYLNENISNKSGFRMGVLMDYIISKKIYISPRAELSFNNAQLIFPSPDNKNTTFSIMPANLEFMTHFTFKIGNPYFYFGPNIRIPVSYQENYETILKTKTNFGIDMGVGFEKLTNSFIFSPELRYSFGLSKVNQSPPELYFNNFTLLLNFK